jgi:hypothetical protein
VIQIILQVLGTFITEWEEGRQQCETFLGDVETAEHAARQLASIASFYRFEGWLINIENELPQSAIPVLLVFLQCVPAAQPSRHASLLQHLQAVLYNLKFVLQCPGCSGAACNSRAARPL